MTEPDDDDFLGDDDWEDTAQIEQIRARFPSNWLLVKLPDFDHHLMSEMAEWLREYTYHAYEQVGWRSGCSSSVGVIFAEASDAIYFKLRWR